MIHAAYFVGPHDPVVYETTASYVPRQETERRSSSATLQNGVEVSPISLGEVIGRGTNEARCRPIDSIFQSLDRISTLDPLDGDYTGFRAWSASLPGSSLENHISQAACCRIS